uniref:Uncharacterized protein n=1 Tax=Gopherus agassizii TaxID=38772 RepID=A0A452HJJ9_9SAUR
VTEGQDSLSSVLHAGRDCGLVGRSVDQDSWVLLPAVGAAHTELQVLLFGEGPRHLLGCSPNLHMLPRRMFLDGQAAPPWPLTTIHRAILEGSWQVVYFGLVDLLVDAFLHVLKYDRELQGKKKEARLDQKSYVLVPVNRDGERGKRKGL